MIPSASRSTSSEGEPRASPGRAGDKPVRRRRHWDLSRLVARLLCAVFALIGAVPLVAGVLVRTKPVLEWASKETARVLHEELGLTASYSVEIQILPLSVALKDVVVPSNDGGPAFLTASSVAVRPRIFALLAGRLDVGDVEIEEPVARVVLRDGKLTNLSYKLPESKGAKSDRAPFSSLAVTDAELNLDVDGTTVKTGPMDLDVFAERGKNFEIGLRATDVSLVRKRSVTIEAKAPDAARDLSYAAVDEDVVCHMDLRARVEGSDILIRRLSLLGVADSDQKEGTQPKCIADEDSTDPWRVGLRLSQVHVQTKTGQMPEVSGHVVVRVPLGLTNRFVRTGPLSGWVGFAGDVSWDGRARLPDLRGRVRGADIQLERYKLAQKLDVNVDVSDSDISIPRLEMHFADGVSVLSDAHIRPFDKGVPITASRVEGDGMKFQGLMRDLGVTEKTVIAWDLDKTHVSKVRGTISPLHIDADLVAETKNFEVYDRGFKDPARKHMIGVHSATVRSKIGVRPNVFELYDTRASFGKSLVHVSLVSIGFDNDISLAIAKSKIDLSDAAPLIDIPWGGVAEISAKMTGKSNDPILTGDLSIQKFMFGGFPIGDIKSAKARFQPLKVDFFDVHGHKGKSDFIVPTARLDFDTKASLVADATMRSERLDVRDFFAMFQFDQDPRFEPIYGMGKVDTRIHYELGGPKDRCGGGNLNVSGRLDMTNLDLFEERYDSGRADFEFRWVDRDASYLGIELDVPSLTLEKGSGTLLASLNMSRGGVLRGHVVGTAVPISKIDSLGTAGLLIDGRVSGVGEIEGTVDELGFKSHVRVSPIRVGTATLPPSELSIDLRPKKRPLKVIGRTHCNGAITPEFDRAEYDSDLVAGTFHVSGKMFDKQIAFDDVQVTRQRAKKVRGKVAFADLDIGSLAELSPSVATSARKPSGHVTGSLTIDDLAMDNPATAKGQLRLTKLEVEQGSLLAELEPGAQPIQLEDGELGIPGLTLAVRTPSGQRGVLDLRGTVTGLGKRTEVDASMTLRPMDLAKLKDMLPRAERVQGSLGGKLTVKGPVNALRYKGGFALDNGEVVLRGLPAPITDVRVGVSVDNDEIRIDQASARMGSGTLKITGSAPLRGFDLGAARAVITAREISLPLGDGVKTVADADLVATWEPPGDNGSERSLPRIAGDLTLRSFEYTRPVTMTADIASVVARGKRTVFEAYDPEDDFLEIDIRIRANRSLKLSNDLIEAELVIGKDGLELGGTNQRFGLRGDLRLKPGGHIRLRRNEFEIRQGTVRFDDLTRIAPQVDVTAVTEYRRYSDSSSGEKNAAASSTTSSQSGGTAAQGGHWRISMHAHGDADKLKIDLTSDPALAQDDIFLLLTVGLTRAELDQSQSASVGESVALEALGTLSGADRAVTEALPVIDEFRFGSAYSSRTGRTEPTVTIGKRLAERIRANVTSGLAESREIRSNIEWRLSNRVSLEGSYDNVNDISSSSLGNLGADIRWRLEFE